MPAIQQKYPAHIQAEDKPIFDIAFEHDVPEPSLIVYANCWWNPFTGTELKGFRTRIKYVLITVFKMRPIKRLGEATWVIDKYSGNYFHWINDVLPKIIFLQSKNINCPVIIPGEISAFTYIEESLKLLNIRYVLLPKKGFYIIRRLFVPSVGGSGGQDFFYFPLLQKKLRSINLYKIPEKKLFISRQNTSNRKIAFFEEAEMVLKHRGIEIICPELLTFKQQSALFSSATHLIGIHGAGLSNMIFMQPGTRVLEIRRDNDLWNFCYYFMAATLKLDYYYFMAKSAGVSNIVQEDDFRIDLSLFEPTLDNFLSNTNRI